MSLELWEKNRWIDIHSPTNSEMTALVETAEHAINQAETLDGLSLCMEDEDGLRCNSLLCQSLSIQEWIQSFKNR